MIVNSSDLTLLNAHLHQIVDEPFLFASMSYGDEPAFDFGAEEWIDMPRGRRIRKGSIDLICRASEVASTVTDQSTGSTIKSAEAQLSAIGYALTIALSDGSTIHVEPVIEEDNDGSDLSDWELQLSHDQFLRVGPGPVWSLLPSNVPLNDLPPVELSVTSAVKTAGKAV